ncbi:hypothetical protein V865_006495 [Kwoniella europaea PYCC6329]|uniref:Uncharacterized protein n=1 Tax=Kwoniella europaea PYCC6329 TaxID=1423913 RepID=A0AAX4KQ93_9TREE
MSNNQATSAADFQQVITETITKIQRSVNAQTSRDTAAYRQARIELLQQFQSDTVNWTKETFAHRIANQQSSRNPMFITAREREELASTMRNNLTNSGKPDLQLFRGEIDWCSSDIRDTYTEYHPRNFLHEELTGTDTYRTQLPEEALLDWLLSKEADRLKELAEDWYEGYQRRLGDTILPAPSLRETHPVSKKNSSSVPSSAWSPLGTLQWTISFHNDLLTSRREVIRVSLRPQKILKDSATQPGHSHA